MAPSTNAILRAYHARVGALRNGTADRLEQIWYSLPEYRDSNIDQFLDVVEPVLEASKERTAQLTSAYHQQMALSRNERPIPTALLGGAALNQPRGVANDIVYRRPANSLYTALSEGLSMTQAVERGATRLRSLVTTDLQLVKTKQSQRSLQAGGFEYYRRVLNGQQNCALCVIASTQRYRVRDLLPIHPGCQCTVDTVRADFDPGQVIDDDLLEQIHALISEELGVESDRGARDLGLQKLIETPAGETKLADYTELIFTRQHGEYGPTLTFRSHEFQERFLIGLSGGSVAIDRETLGVSDLLRFDADAPRGLNFIEEEVIDSYTGSGYRNINTYLRDESQITWPTDRLRAEEEIDVLDNLLSRSEINEPVTVYRGTSWEAFGNVSFQEIALSENSVKPLVGMEYQAPAFVSTSKEQSVAQKFIQGRQFSGQQSGSIEIRINLQPGDSGLDISAVTADLEGEFEVLLPRNQRFRIVDAIDVSEDDPLFPGSFTSQSVFIVEPVRD